MLDCQIGNAAPGIEPVRRNDCAGRAGCQASRAAPAMIGGRRIDRQWKVDEYLANEKAGTGRRRRTGVTCNQQGMLAAPAEARALGEFCFKHRGGISENAGTGRNGVSDAFGQLSQACTHNLVVIASQGVTGNIGECAITKHPGGWGCVRPVVDTRGNHPGYTGHQSSRLQARRNVPRHIIHIAVATGSKPVPQPFARSWRQPGFSNG